MVRPIGQSRVEVNAGYRSCACDWLCWYVATGTRRGKRCALCCVLRLDDQQLVLRIEHPMRRRLDKLVRRRFEDQSMVCLVIDFSVRSTGCPAFELVPVVASAIYRKTWSSNSIPDSILRIFPAFRTDLSLYYGEVMAWMIVVAGMWIDRACWLCPVEDSICYLCICCVAYVYMLVFQHVAYTHGIPFSSFGSLCTLLYCCCFLPGCEGERQYRTLISLLGS
ncbi:hypothetical protein F511_44210 [Dorcoceras hygrometricum]|uniref:Uncharacterized protein n=1 Tax=Dorcoceras hygrometricum TaxID=472368 RepID=A0A2Z6ZZB7_9LAMI|nr:hypothetical protein F511_44210 [Dorcoceras hygrometricum]